MPEVKERARDLDVAPATDLERDRRRRAEGAGGRSAVPHPAVMRASAGSRRDTGDVICRRWRSSDQRRDVLGSIGDDSAADDPSGIDGEAERRAGDAEALRKDAFGVLHSSPDVIEQLYPRLGRHDNEFKVIRPSAPEVVTLQQLCELQAGGAARAQEEDH